MIMSEIPDKIGTFDWIIDYSNLSPYFDEQYTGLSNKCRDKQTVLVIGCGTSLLSSCMLHEGKYPTIISLDNDLGCIQHMKCLHDEEHDRLKWLHYDLIERTGEDADYFRHVNKYFDLIVDKGTLDAILVEGSVYVMLADINRYLKVNGIYMICSIHPKELLSAVLTLPELHFNVTFYDTDDCSGSIAICKKVNDDEVDEEKLMTDEKHCLDHYFKVQTPLLTAEESDAIRLKYEALQRQQGIDGNDDGCNESLSLLQVYTLLFDNDKYSLLGYTYELFIEDLLDFPRAVDAKLSLNEAVAFVQLKQ